MVKRHSDKGEQEERVAERGGGQKRERQKEGVDRRESGRKRGWTRERIMGII